MARPMSKSSVSGDGLVSHDEFRNHHEVMWSTTKKNAAGIEARLRDLRGVARSDDAAPPAQMRLL